jgi:hypothetical protein
VVKAKIKNKKIGYTKKTIKKSLNTIVTFVFSILLLEKKSVFFLKIFWRALKSMAFSVL